MATTRRQLLPSLQEDMIAALSTVSCHTNGCCADVISHHGIIYKCKISVEFILQHQI